jgi:hypothetical protein
MSRLLCSLLAAAVLATGLPAKELLEIKGDYLLYSYDFNYIYGQGNIHLRSKNWAIQAGMVEVDVVGRVARASRDCRVESGQQKFTADLLEIDLETLALKFTTFKESIRSWTLPGEPAAAGEKSGAAKQITRRDLEGLKKSLVYFLNYRIVISTLYRVYGYQTTVFIEGVQSLSFKKFSLDRGGDTSQLRGFWVDRIWYYASQGLVLNSHFLLENAVKKGKVKSFNGLDVKYDFFNQVESGPALRVNFNSQNSFSLSRRHEAGLNVGFLTDNLFQTRLALKSQWTPQWSSEVAAEYSRTVARQEELWLRFRSSLQNKLLGNMALNLAYEKQEQYQADVSLQNQAVKNISLFLQHSRSRLLYGQDAFNRLSSTQFSLAYSHRLFQMAADYQFHKDLVQDQSQGTPRFTLNVTPFRLYHGLLQVNFSSNFMVNQLNLAGKRSDQSRANLALSLQSETIRLGRGPAFQFSLAAEQLLDQERLNRFTSLGGIFKCSQSIAAFADIDFLYNFNTRRQTEAWLIQGSTSQDWSTVLRLKEGSQRVQGWVSVSYDTKAGNFTSGYLDCAISLIKNWQLQTQMNYDFIFKNFNYDFYLIRYAGRIMLRASYRSLSRKFLLEILPR